MPTIQSTCHIDYHGSHLYALSQYNMYLLRAYMAAWSTWLEWCALSRTEYLFHWCRVQAVPLCRPFVMHRTPLHRCMNAICHIFWELSTESFAPHSKHHFQLYFTLRILQRRWVSNVSELLAVLIQTTTNMPFCSRLAPHRPHHARRVRR